MVVGLKVDFFWWPIGDGDFFYSFFSTVCVNIEHSEWGSKFPVLMKDLYQGCIVYEKLEQAIEEIAKVEEKLAKLPPKQVVWSFEDRAKMPPWGDNISPDINNLSDYFVTTDGRNLITVLKDAFNKAGAEQVNVEIKVL